MDEDEMHDYEIFRSRRKPKKVWVWKRRLDLCQDITGPWPVDVSANPAPAVGECVVLISSPGGRQAYGWVHDVQLQSQIYISCWPPALVAMKEAIEHGSNESDK